MNDLVATWRAAFPQYVRGEPYVYLDTAATSLTPSPILDVMDTYYRTYRASVHRGLYHAAECATAAYEDARAQVAAFVGAVPQEIVYTAGATAASNMIVGMLEHTGIINEGDEIVTTVAEHHSALMPLTELARRRGLTVRYVPVAADHTLDIGVFDTLLSTDTRIVSVQLASNVTGAVHDVASFARRARDAGAIVVVDATAAVGHVPCAVRELGADAVYWSGHKCCGPTGTGVLWVRKELLERCEPSVYGGGMVVDVRADGALWSESPGRFEAGTPNVAGVIGLGAAAVFLTQCGVTAIRAHVCALTRYAHSVIGALSGVRLYSAPPEMNVGIVSFTLEGVHPHDVAQVCADRGVAIRAGHHCAIPLHRALGVPATARASLYLYNTPADVDALADAVVAARTLLCQ